MAKRFRDTSISREAWYRKLSSVYKCTWSFLCDDCDAVGMWNIDMDAIVFYLGQEIDIDDFIACVNTDKVRLEKYGRDKIFITGFVDFQYGELTEKCKPHLKYIQLLKKYNLLDRVFKGYAKGIHTLEEKEEEKEQEEEMEKEQEERGSGGKQKKMKTPNIRPEHDSSGSELKADYLKIVETMKDDIELPPKKAKVAEFITQNKPQFIEPYMDLWNLSVRKYGLSQVEAISAGRINKFKTRAKESTFDFIKILTEINQSNYLQGKEVDWKVDWDWIFENDTNYLKIMEGKYRNTKN